MIIKEMSEYERPREKMLRKGKEALSSVELLAILLRTGTKEKTALGVADELLAMSEDGLLFLAQCSIEELGQIKGVGTAKACQ